MKKNKGVLLSSSIRSRKMQFLPSKSDLRLLALYTMLAIFIVSLVFLKYHRINNTFFLFYSLTMVLSIGITISMALGYKSFPIDMDYSNGGGGHTPFVSILIPTYNERWKNLRRTILSALEADYPMKEVIVIDDGSTNDTREKLRGMNGFKLISFRKNRGNKFARAEGIKRAKGEFVIFMDSDTMIEKDAIENIIAPFRDPEVGAVSGHLTVENSKQSALTKMQDGWYFTGFRIYRGIESRLGFVSCCPGAFSAYRRSAITPEVFDEWLYGKFMGLEVSAGVDRALTNLVLRNYKSVYQSTARAKTAVPVGWREFLRQQIRWAKSWIRETIFLSTFAYKKGARSFFFYLTMIFRFLNYIILTFFLIITPFLLREPFLSILYLLGLTLGGFIYALVCRKETSLWKWRIIFPIALGTLSLPIFIYSALTIKNSGWMTRKLD